MGYRTPDTAFGDGSDGHAHFTFAGGATQLLDKPTLNYASLTIDAGVTVKQPNWSAEHWPVLTVYCRSALKIDGILSASSVVAGISDNGIIPGQIADNGGGNINSDGYPPLDAGHRIFPIAGGGAGTASMVTTRTTGEYVPYYSAYSVSPGSPGDSIWLGDAGTRDMLIGPGRLYRYCAGCGGGYSENKGGNGGGIIVIIAPVIEFGPAGGIEAKGGDGVGGAGVEGSGGGGGGYIETLTRTPVDGTKLDVSGGLEGVGQYGTGTAGMNGHIVRRSV